MRTVVSEEVVQSAGGILTRHLPAIGIYSPDNLCIFFLSSLAPANELTHAVGGGNYHDLILRSKLRSLEEDLGQQAACLNLGRQQNVKVRDSQC